MLRRRFRQSNLYGPQPSNLAFNLRSNAASSSDVELQPTIKHSEYLVGAFFEKVDPFIKILHRPTFDKELAQYHRQSHYFQNKFGVLVCSIHAVALTVLRSDIVVAIFGEAKDVLLGRYQREVEKALARVGILQTRNVETYQGLLYCVVSWPVPLDRLIQHL